MNQFLPGSSLDKPQLVTLVLYNSVSYQSVHLIHAKFQSNFAEGLHFSAFHCLYFLRKGIERILVTNNVNYFASERVRTTAFGSSSR